MSLIQPLEQGVIRTLKAHYAYYSMQRVVRAREENPDKDNIMKIWKAHTMESAIDVTERAMRPSSPKNKFLLDKTGSSCCA